MSTFNKAIKQHAPPERENIILEVGDIVQVGDEDTSNPNWIDWVWCISEKHGTCGWVPKQILNSDNTSATVIQNYSSNELRVSTNEELEILSKLNGWSWCKNKSGELGWVPDENFL